ncbi:MAG: PaaI family thioesterase [Pseudorhodobacter sp.]|nr:PaaI family thioesterase [Pseudorhodobacter sp.]
MPLQMEIPALQRFLEREFPQVAADFHLEEVTEDRLILGLRVAERHLRPGGTVSGPTMFGLADVAMYLAILSHLGPVALAVTTNCSIDFLRKPEAGSDLRAEARLLKLGRSLAVGDVLLFSQGVAAPVARAGLTYSIPPKR